jgi:hypothetical protein
MRGPVANVFLTQAGHFKFRSFLAKPQRVDRFQRSAVVGNGHCRRTIVRGIGSSRWLRRHPRILKVGLSKSASRPRKSAAFVVFLAFGSCWLVLGNIGTAFVRNARDLGDDTPDPARRASRHAGHSCQARRTSEGSREAHDDLMDVDKDAEEVERERAHQAS